MNVVASDETKLSSIKKRESGRLFYTKIWASIPVLTPFVKKSVDVKVMPRVSRCSSNANQFRKLVVSFKVVHSSNV